MSSWVISSNPVTYDAESALAQHGEVDWVALNKFQVGDTVYIYEVLPPRGRGAIVYKTTVSKTNISFAEKLEDRQFWTDRVYPKNLEQARFSRLKLDTNLNSDGLSLKALKENGFTAPQGRAYLLDNNPKLLSYIESQCN